MSIKPSFTCVACEYRGLPFDPQESAGTCPECQHQYVDQPERVSKSKLRDEIKQDRDWLAATSFFEAQEQAGVEPPVEPTEPREMPSFEEAAEDLVGLVEKAAEVDPKLRAQIEGDGEQAVERPEKIGFWPFGHGQKIKRQVDPLDTVQED